MSDNASGRPRALLVRVWTDGATASGFRARLVPVPPMTDVPGVPAADYSRVCAYVGEWLGVAAGEPAPGPAPVPSGVPPGGEPRAGAFVLTAGPGADGDVRIRFVAATDVFAGRVRRGETRRSADALAFMRRWLAEFLGGTPASGGQ
jgi:hypothetical protein